MTPTELDTLIQVGLALEDAQSTIDYFEQLRTRFPDEAMVVFETAGAYDSAGREAEALPHYRRAFELGLPDDVLPRFAVQYGSTLRNVGEYEESVRVLSEAKTRFPDNRPVRAFLALALFSNGQPAEALAAMLDLTLDAEGFYDRYTRSLRNYAADLRVK